MLTPKNRKTLFLLAVATVGALCVYAIKNINRKSLRKNRHTEIALVTDVTEVHREDGLWVNYRFKEHGQIVDGSKRLSVHAYMLNVAKETLVNQYLPVAVDSTDYSNNELLLTNEDFSAYSLSYPDSIASLVGDLFQHR